MVWQLMLQSPILLEHERNYGLGTNALVTVFSWNTNGILVWTGALVTVTFLNGVMVLGMDALVTVF